MENKDAILEAIKEDKKDAREARTKIYEKLNELTVTATRVEERVSQVKEDLDNHEQSDDQRFDRLHDAVQDLVIHAEVTKATSAKTAGKISLIGASGLTAVFEIIRRFLGG